MASPLSSTVVIECPDCGTRYRLPPDAIGPKGRKVACAHCGGTWQAKAEPEEKDPDRLFDEEAEAALDEAFAAAERVLAASKRPPTETEPPEAPVAEASADEQAHERSIAEIKAAIAPRPRPHKARTDSVADKKRQKAFDKRQAAIISQLPLARVRRGLRIAGVSVLALMLVGGVVFRTEIVRQVPDLAGAYEAVGLGVNIVGLEFRDVTTLVTLRNGAKVMQVDARIYNVAARNLVVPPVMVSLLDDNGSSLYSWSVTPDAHDLEGGEVVDFSTQLSSPPEGATHARLAFTDGKARPRGAVTAAATNGK